MQGSKEEIIGILRNAKVNTSMTNFYILYLHCLKEYFQFYFVKFQPVSYQYFFGNNYCIGTCFPVFAGLAPQKANLESPHFTFLK